MVCNSDGIDLLFYLELIANMISKPKDSGTYDSRNNENLRPVIVPVLSNDLACVSNFSFIFLSLL